MRVRIAYVEEPPFYATDDDATATGSDIELAEVVFAALGASVDFQPTTFEELLPGVQEGRWDVNVPIFVTSERAERVAFSIPVWSLGDGFLVPHGNPKDLTSYQTVAARSDARLGLIPGQVQVDAANSAGVSETQIRLFADQPAAIAALLAGEIDAFAATAVGNRVVADAEARLQAVPLDGGSDSSAPVGAFSFSKSNAALLRSVDAQLHEYLGSPDHRTRMAKYGLTRAELDGVIPRAAG